MNKPLLVIVTGSLASGKTTLTHTLANRMNFPFLSRDALKEGLVNTLNMTHAQLDKSVDLQVCDTFFETIELLLSKGISLIAEAAFQDKLWRPQLLKLVDKAEIKIIVCTTNLDLLRTRFANRLANNPDREKYHGDQSISLSSEQFTSMIENYKPVTMDVPTLQVDTTANYDPTIEEIIRFIRDSD